jgi:hypothetical protein
LRRRSEIDSPSSRERLQYREINTVGFLNKDMEVNRITTTLIRFTTTMRDSLEVHMARKEVLQLLKTLHLHPTPTASFTTDLGY